MNQISARSTKIIESAANCFLARGFAETSVDDISNQSGVVKQTIYNNFANKEALFQASLDLLIQRVAARPERSWLNLKPADFIEKVCKLQLKTLQDSGTTDFLRLLVKECRRFPDLQRVYAEHIPKPTIDLISDYIENSQYVSVSIKGAPAHVRHLVAWCIRSSVVGFAALGNLGPLVQPALPNKSEFLRANAELFARLLTSDEIVWDESALLSATSNSAHGNSSEHSSFDAYLSRAVAPGKRKRQEILLGALKVFSRDGFADASMDNIATISGASKQTVYKYFRSKTELYNALFDEMRAFLGTINLPSTGGNNAEFVASYCRSLLAPIDGELMREYSRMVLGESTTFPLQSGMLLLQLLNSGRSLLQDQLIKVGRDEAASEMVSLVQRCILGTFMLTRNIYVLDSAGIFTERALCRMLVLLAL